MQGAGMEDGWKTESPEGFQKALTEGFLKALSESGLSESQSPLRAI